MTESDRAPIVALSLLAWAPVFESFERVLGPKIYRLIYPDWRAAQSAAVEAMCSDPEKIAVVVADVDGVVAAFLAYELDHVQAVGEVQMLAVHPDYQRRGIGTALNTWALARFKALGMRLAVVGTGGDPGHAPARAAYEKVGYTPLPIVRYYQDL